jgi:hypothetical protein
MAKTQNDRMINNDWQNNTEKTKDWATQKKLNNSFWNYSPIYYNTYEDIVIKLTLIFLFCR